MIDFQRFELANGLRVLVHEDASTPMAAINVLYNVGAKDEQEDKTGFAHLFEHLMFSGSLHIKDFDEPIQRAGGDSNAFTNSDITNFYDTLPASNIETAFWLESDRMLGLSFSKKGLEVQRKVVVEEFKETCLNAPYGDVWHHLAGLAYKVHPYRWPTIGKVPKHIEDATMEDVKSFFHNYYRPNNAILVVAGNVTLEQIKTLSEKWFGDIPAGEVPKRNLPKEPVQTKLQRFVQQGTVPLDALYMAFHIPERTHPDYYKIDLLSDVLSNGRSARLYRRLLKEQKLFISIDAYITGNIDPGLLIIEGKPAEGVSLAAAEEAIWKEIALLQKEKISDEELQKLKNKVESTLVFSEASILNKAINLAFFEVLGDAQMINDEVQYYEQVSVEGIHEAANQVLARENCSILYYEKKKETVG